MSKRHISLIGDIDEKSFNKVNRALDSFDDSDKHVTIRLCSTGGNTYDALAIIDRIKSAKQTVVVEGYGCVMSCAFGILLAADIRRLGANAVCMSHCDSYKVKGAHKDIKIEVAQREREEVQWTGILAAHSSKTADWWMRQHETGDVYFTPKQLLDIGAIDEII